MSSPWPPTPLRIGKYTLGHTIGKGSFSLVKEGENIETHDRIAVKIIPRKHIISSAGLERFEREVRVMLKMHHPGVITVYDCMADRDFLYLIMELVTGDTLLSQTLIGGGMNEATARPIFKQLLATVAYIHDQGIAHRDLKLENILCNAKGQVKIVDFGFSRCARSPGELFRTSCGSPAYAAPEILEEKPYDGCMADMWSMGVILYALITGTLPWRANNQNVLYEQISRADYEIPATVSVLCSDLIRKLLNVNPALRLTAKEAGNHPWLEGITTSWQTTGTIAPSLTEVIFLRLLGTGFVAPSLSAMRAVPVIPRRFGPPRGVSCDGKMRRFAPGTFQAPVGDT
jgi:serine/threonine protein kinase